MQVDRPYSRRGLLLRAVTAAVASSFGPPIQAQSARRPKAVVDSQVNIWIGGKPPSTRRQAPFLATDLLSEMTEAGVDRALIIPVSWNPDGAESAITAANSYPERFRVFGVFDIAAPPNQASVDALYKRQGVAGLRLFLNSPRGRAWMTDGSADWFWPIAERENIPLMIYPTIIPALQNVAQKYPNLRICVDSLGALPAKRGMDAFAEHEAILALAKLPNVVIKLSALASLSGESYPFRDLDPILRRTYEAFGANRMFWGSDITSLEPLKVSYSQCIDSFTELAWLSDDDLDLIMGRAISNWINWPLPA